MDRKLKTIENLIIEDTAKYYENHDGMSLTNVIQDELMLLNFSITNVGSLSPSEARVLRNRVADRLSTAYSLEKMRKAIGRLKESMEFEKNLEKNLLQGGQTNSDDDDDKKKKAKRVAIKKEKAEFDNNE